MIAFISSYHAGWGFNIPNIRHLLNPTPQIAKRDECIKALRAALQQLLGSKDEFVKVLLG